MSFFYDLNKRMADLANKQDLTESKVAESEKWIQKAVDPKHKGDLHKALHVAQDKKIPKAKIEKATHSKNPKLRHMAQFAKNVANEEMADEGNAFTGKLANTPKGEKFKLGDKEFKDTSEIEEGFADMDAWLASREKEKGTGKFDKKERTLPGGMKATTYTRRQEEEPSDDEEVTTITIKKKGRPKGPAKGPERTTKGAWKHKGERKVKEGDMEGSRDHDEAGEYGAEGDYVKNELHTMVRVARDLEKHLRDNEDLPTWCIGKLSQAKGMVVSVMDYIMSEKERGAEAEAGEEGITLVPEKAVSKAQRKFMGMAHAIQKGEKIKGASPELKKVAKTMKPSDTHDFAVTKEKDLPKKVKKTEEGAKPDFLDVDKDGNKKETFKKAVADKKDDKVDETTTSGSVATAPADNKKSSGGMQFGKGVYEGFNNQVESIITESIDVTETVVENDGAGKTLTVTASGPEADMLMQLLKAAGLTGQNQGCGCGTTPCSCEQPVDEAYGDTDETKNNPDWPTDTAVTGADDPYLRRLSGGPNGPKSTGQTTVPVVASQLRRQVSMEENVELERSLFKTWKNYKG